MFPGPVKERNAKRRKRKVKFNGVAKAIIDKPILKAALKVQPENGQRGLGGGAAAIPGAGTPDPPRRKVRFGSEESEIQRPASITPLAQEWNRERSLDQQERNSSADRTAARPPKGRGRKGKGKGKGKSKSKGKGRK